MWVRMFVPWMGDAALCVMDHMFQRAKAWSHVWFLSFSNFCVFRNSRYSPHVKDLKRRRPSFPTIASGADISVS